MFAIYVLPEAVLNAGILSIGNNVANLVFVSQFPETNATAHARNQTFRRVFEAVVE